MKNIFIAVLALSVVFTACNSERSKMQARIDELEKKVIKDSSSFTFDVKVEKDLSKALIEYADKFPEDKKAEEHLFKAGSLYMGMAQSKEAIDVFHKYLKAYPEGPNAPQSVFNIAFIYDSQLHDKGKALESYDAFLSKYPSHALAKDAKELIAILNSGVSDEELVKGFLKNVDDSLKALDAKASKKQ